jgi:methylated-DNA-protein-cysteine methyltransferase-like protein
VSTYDQIYAVVRQIPEGQVATYGQVAELAGLGGKARLVGYALYRVDMRSSDIPWHRVINAKGEISHRLS